MKNYDIVAGRCVISCPTGYMQQNNACYKDTTKDVVSKNEKADAGKDKKADAGLSGFGKSFLVISYLGCAFGIGFCCKRRKARRERAFRNEILLSGHDRYDNKDLNN